MEKQAPIYEKYDNSGVRVHDERGRELPDPTPMAPPVGYKRQPSLHEQIREAVLAEKLRAAYETGEVETFEEADDFDIGDDYDPTSPYEANFDPMSEADKAALSSRGKAVDKILGPIPPKPSTKASVAPGEGATQVSDPAKPGGSAEPK